MPANDAAHFFDSGGGRFGTVIISERRRILREIRQPHTASGIMYLASLRGCHAFFYENLR
jgi:hypothetical protein